MTSANPRHLPVIAGAGGGGKGGSGGAPTSYAPSEIPDSLRSRAYIDAVFALGEGPYAGIVPDENSHVYFDGVPIDDGKGGYNFPGSWFWKRMGWQDQTPIFPDSMAAADHFVNVEVQQATPWELRITDEEIDTVIVTVGYPQMARQDPKTGQVGGTLVELEFLRQYKETGFYPLPIGYGPVGWRKASNHVIQATQFAWDCRFFVRAPGAQYRKLRVYIGPDYNTKYLYTNSFELFHDDRTNSAVATGLVRWDQGGTFFVWIEPADGGDWNMAIEWATFYGQSYVHQVNGKCLQRYQQQFKFTREYSGTWDIRVRRITADSKTASVADQTWVDAYRTESSLHLKYPNTALLAVRLPADQFSTVPRVQSDWYCLQVQVPTNYNPWTRAYVGEWDGTSFYPQWTSNPAWCLYALLTNTRWGLGEHDIPIDKWGFYALGRYCDELIPDGKGGSIPRFECHLSLDAWDEAYSWLQTMAACFRGMLYLIDGEVTAVADKADDPAYLFNNTNVVDGRFEYTGSSDSARHTAVYVTWRDPDDLGHEAVEFIPDAASIARYGFNPISISAMWVRHRRHARLIGEWLLETEKRCTQVVTFRPATVEAACLRPGQIIEVADANRAGERRGGRIIDQSETSITVDQIVEIYIGTAHTLRMIGPQGQVIERAVTGPKGWTSEIHFADPIPADRLDGAVWLLDAPGRIQAQRFRILEIEESDDATSIITALEHEPTLFAHIERGRPFTDTRIISSKLPGPPSKPELLKAEESLYFTPDQVLMNRISLSWAPSTGATQYRIRWRRSPGNWLDGGISSDTTWELEHALPGNYKFSVTAINALNRRSDETVLAFRALGKTAPPPRVQGFRVVSLRDGRRRAVFAYRAASVPLDLRGFELRYGKGALTAADWRNMTRLHTGVVSASPWEFALPVTGTYTFGVVGVDTSGNRSRVPLLRTVKLPPPPVEGDVLISRSAREANWPGEASYV